MEIVNVSLKIKAIFAAGFIILTGLLAFLYRFITNFPIGDDPAVHINVVKTTSYSGLLNYNYPIPLAIFKFLGQLTHIPYQSLFIPMECGTLFLAALALWLLAKKITNSNVTAVISSLFFVTSYWTYDGLRMGLMAETFGWLILILTFYFLVSKKYWLTLLFTVLLIFSHPYSFTIYSLFFAAYALVILIFAQKESKIFIVKIIGCYVVLALLAYLARPELLHKFVNFVNPERIGWGEHNLFVFFTASGLRRVCVAIFALIGIVAGAKNWKNDSFKFLYAFLFVGLFMAFNQYFGIRFQVFRFFPYFEMPIAIFAVLGISALVKTFNFEKRLVISTVLLLSLFVLIPAIKANWEMTYKQSHVAKYDDSMTRGDRKAIAWVKDNIPADKVVVAPYKRYLWLVAVGDHGATAANDRFVMDKQTDKNLLTIGRDYIYYPEIYPAPAEITDNYGLVYNKDGVQIYEEKSE